MPNSENRILGEKGDANILRSPFTLPLTNVSTQFCTVDVASLGNRHKTSAVKFVFRHWLMFVITSPAKTSVLLTTRISVKHNFTMKHLLLLLLSTQDFLTGA